MNDQPHYIDPHGPEAKAMAAKVWERYVRDVADPEDVKRYGMDEGMKLAPLKVPGHPVMWDNRDALADPEKAVRYRFNGKDYWVGDPPDGMTDPLTGAPVKLKLTEVYDTETRYSESWVRIDKDGMHKAEAPDALPNPSGIVPNEYKVLILPDAVEEKTKGGIIIPVSKKEIDEFAMTTGTLIACSPLAFTYASEAEWKDAFARKPQAGDRIIYERYVGVRVKGPKDGVEYVLCNDRSIFATVEK